MHRYIIILIAILFAVSSNAATVMPDIPPCATYCTPHTNVQNLTTVIHISQGYNSTLDISVEYETWECPSTGVKDMVIKKITPLFNMTGFTTRELLQMVEYAAYQSSNPYGILPGIGQQGVSRMFFSPCYARARAKGLTGEATGPEILLACGDPCCVAVLNMEREACGEYTGSKYRQFVSAYYGEDSIKKVNENMDICDQILLHAINLSDYVVTTSCQFVCTVERPEFVVRGQLATSGN